MEASIPLRLNLSREHIRPGDRVCAAVSGGADSVALLLTLVAANRQPREALGVVLSAVHVHHNLRGDEADADEAFVTELCARLAVPLSQRRVDVRAHVAETGQTVEEAARNLRSQCYQELIAAQETDSVLTGHTLDDQAETVMMKLLRGAWTDGLGAISPSVPMGRGSVVRPFLRNRRREIEEYLREAGQPWREDSSNRDAAFTRNRVRHELMPTLRSYNPKIDQALANMAELAREEEARWQAEVERILPQLLLPGKPVRGGGRAVGTAPGHSGAAIELDRLRELHPALRRRVLRAAARQLGARLDFEETARLLALCGFETHSSQSASTGKTLQLSSQLRAERSMREVRLFLAEPAVRKGH